MCVCAKERFTAIKKEHVTTWIALEDTGLNEIGPTKMGKQHVKKVSVVKIHFLSLY